MSGASSLYSSVDAGGTHDSTLEAQFRERLAAIDQVTAPLRPSSQRGDGSRASTPCLSNSPTLLSVGAAFFLVFCALYTRTSWASRLGKVTNARSEDIFAGANMSMTLHLLRQDHVAHNRTHMVQNTTDTEHELMHRHKRRPKVPTRGELLSIAVPVHPACVRAEGWACVWAKFLR